MFLSETSLFIISTAKILLFSETTKYFLGFNTYLTFEPNNRIFNHKKDVNQEVIHVPKLAHIIIPIDE